jgi:nucleotide-binding universal stress UspA family protein
MLRGILVALDGSKSSESARELGIRWAKQYDAMLCGLGIVDQPAIRTTEPAAAVGGAPGRDPVYYLGYDARLEVAGGDVKTFLDAFSDRCAAEGVACAVHECQGTPAEQIRLEAQRYDLVLLGRETHFRFATQDRADDTLHRVLKAGPRPVVSVPEQLGRGDAVVVAYDGSVQAARALYAFAASGIGPDRRVEVVCSDIFLSDAEQTADRAVAFLRSHGVDAAAFPVESKAPPAGLIVTRARLLDAGLIVMGAYGQKALREIFFGSVTRTVLDEAAVPVFCFN